jgi:uncharacterized protein
MTPGAIKKYNELKKNMTGMGKILVAFSGGVDSTLLLKAGAEALGAGNVVAVTVFSRTRHKDETRRAAKAASRFGVEHVVIRTDELSIPEVRANGKRRCFYCKKNIFSAMRGLARERGIKYVLEASTMDDLKVFRPGRDAIKKLGIRSPLCEAGFFKKDVREVLKGAGLRVWSAPSESCLLTRFPYGRDIKTSDLEKVRKAEEFLKKKGFSQVRVRTYSDMARIEVSPDGLKNILSAKNRKKVIDFLKELGYKYVTVDMEGFRSGSMDE